MAHPEAPLGRSGKCVAQWTHARTARLLCPVAVLCGPTRGEADADDACGHGAQPAGIAAMGGRVEGPPYTPHDATVCIHTDGPGRQTTYTAEAAGVYTTATCAAYTRATDEAVAVVAVVDAGGARGSYTACAYTPSPRVRCYPVCTHALALVAVPCDATQAAATTREQSHCVPSAGQGAAHPLWHMEGRRAPSGRVPCTGAVCACSVRSPVDEPSVDHMGPVGPLCAPHSADCVPVAEPVCLASVPRVGPRPRGCTVHHHHGHPESMLQQQSTKRAIAKWAQCRRYN